MAKRHSEFLERGGRVFGISADTPEMNAAVITMLALPFPILSDPGRDRAIIPLGFADEKDPRRISRPGTLIIAPNREIVYSVTGRDYADRPNEDLLLERLGDLGLPPTSQPPPRVGEARPGETAMTYEGLRFYLRGAKFAALATRNRHRGLGEEFSGDMKRYVQLVERYLDALPDVEARKA